MHEVLRKGVHLLIGLSIAIAIPLVDMQLVLMAFVLAIFVGFILSDAISKGYKLPLISRVVLLLERKDVMPGKGTLYFAIGVFFPLQVVIPAIICLAVLDGVATLVGIHYGHHKIWKSKSLEGTLAGMVTTVIALLVLTPLSIPLAAAAAITAGVMELLSPVDDNLTIPLSVCIVLSLLLLL
jgi:phytol kinase